MPNIDPDPLSSGARTVPSVEPTHGAVEAPGLVPWRWLRLLLLVGALGAAIAGQYWLSIQYVARWSAAAWVFAGLAFVALYFLSAEDRGLPALEGGGLSRSTERTLLAAVLGVGLFFGFFRLWEFPPGLNHDAAWEGLYAIRILQRAVPYAPYVNMAWGRETMTFYFRALSILLLGRTPLAIELPSVIAGVLTLPFFYWWARNTFGARFSLLATLLLGASGWHLIFSRTGWRSDFQPLFETITCCFFIRAMLTAAPRDFAIAGLGLSLALNTYNAARILPMLFPLWLLAYIAHSRQVGAFFKRYGLGLVAMAVTFGITIAPLAWYATHHWIEFQGRALALQGETTFPQALKQTALLFNCWGNGNDFFVSTPGLEFPAAVFLGFGLLWALLSIRDTRAQFLLLGLVISLVPGLVSKPNMNRDIGTMPFVYFFVALGVTFFAVQARALIPRTGRALATALTVVVAAAAMVATYTQYLSHNRRDIWGYYPETTALGKYIRTLVPRYQVWVGDTPYFPRDTMTFMAYLDEGNPLEERNYIWLDDVTSLLRTNLTAPPGKGMAFLFENTGRATTVVKELQRRYPDNELVTLRYPENSGPIFAIGVLVPAAGVTAKPAAAIITASETPAPEPETPQAGPPGKLGQPRGVAVNSDGNVLVCDFGNNRIQEFGPDLHFLDGWGTFGKSPGEFKQPCGIAIGPSGEIFVADTWNQRVQVFSKTGQFVRQWSGAFYGPRGIAVDAKGSVFVADTGNNRVVRFSAEGSKEVEWGGKGPEPGHFIEPVGVAVGSGAQVYVCDNGNSRLQMFSRDGKFIKAFPVPGWEVKPYSEPNITLDQHGTIWVTVPAAKEIRAYDKAGTLRRTITGSSIKGVSFDTPLGISYSPATKELIVSDLENRLVRIPVAGK
jgi:DNA-binding beta-propeller fold protein YncE